MEASARGAGGAEGGSASIDWQAIEASAEFRELTAARRRFVVPATIFFLAFFFAWLLLAALAPGFMSLQVWGGMTIGFLLAAAQIFMTWIITILYLRKSDRELEPLERRAAERAVERADEPAATRRRDR